ncbi:MAG: putative signal transducing protein [Vibrio hibernica]
MKIYSASTPIEAHIVCGLLQSQGVEVKVYAEDLFSLKGEIPLTSETDPYIWLLNAQDETLARNIIQDYESEESEGGINWQCSSCGEIVEPQFSICWNCEREKS